MCCTIRGDCSIEKIEIVTEVKYVYFHSGSPKHPLIEICFDVDVDAIMDAPEAN